MRKLVVAVLGVVVAASGTPAEAAGTIAGKVKFDGPAPVRRAIKMAADPVCEKANPEGKLGEVMVINDGALANVFVYIKDGLGDQKFEVPSTPAVLDQQGCMYTPHVLGIMVGQILEIRNSDPTLHNVHALPEKSPQFNNAMPLQGMTIKKKFASPEIMVHTKCDVHPWMSAYIGVLPHPFHAVSGMDGSFTIPNVPAGTYTVEAWHEFLGTKTATATIADDGTASLDFTFEPKAQ